jgi:hypothetical protein
MAYSDYPSYVSAFKKANDLAFYLKGASDRPELGLAASLASTRNKYGINSKEYKAIKAKYDAKDKEYKAAVSALAKIKAKIDSTAAKAKADAAKAKATSSAKSDIPSLEAQIAAAKEQNKPYAEVKILQDKLDALKGVVAGTPPIKVVTPTGDPTGLGEWDKYTVNTQYGTVSMPGGSPVYFANVKGPDGKMAIKGFTSMSLARTEFLKGYTTDAEISALKNQLVNSGYIKANKVNTSEWLGAVDTMLAEYTYGTMVAYKYEGAKTPPLISKWLPTRTAPAATSKAGTETVPYTNLSTRIETNRQADLYFQEWFNRPATQAEKNAFFTDVNKAEVIAVSKRTTTTDSQGNATKVINEGSFLTDGDRLIIAAKIAKPLIANMDIDALIASGGKAAQNINELNAYAASMGLPKDNKYVLQAAQNMLDSNGNGLAAEKEKIKNEAMLHFKPLASHIQAGGTIQTAAEAYQKIRSQILETQETPVADLTKDPDLMEAMGGGSLMSLGDFQRRMYQDPRYGKTKAAHESAADYASTVLKAFGLMT